jgi:hypothetical protein
VTYTQQLTDNARTFFEACGVGDRVEVLTLNTLLQQFHKEHQKQPPPSLSEFDQFVNQEFRKNLLGDWRGHSDLLWIEIRAFLYGMALPFDWNRDPIGRVAKSNAILNRDTYQALRHDVLTGEAIEQAHNMAETLKDSHDLSRFFPSVAIAKETLSRLSSGSGDNNTKLTTGFAGLIVDEIQDFTLAEIALLTEVARLNSIGNDNRQFAFLLAGDESQTVQPSGFDWGVTKNFVGERLGRNSIPSISLQEQLRSPVQIEALVEKSWNLYSHFLPKGLIPKKKLAQISVTDDFSQANNILWFTVPGGFDWQELFSALHIDSAVVELENVIDENIKNPLRYTVPEIKGLDREIVVIVGLSQSIARLKEDRNGNTVGHLANRQRIDQIRVALSRSVDLLIIADNMTPTAVEPLSIPEPKIVDWNSLKTRLVNHVKNLDNVEKLYNYVWVIEESIGKEDYERASLLHQRACEEIQEDEFAEELSNLERKIVAGLAKNQLDQNRALINKGDFDTVSQSRDQIENWLATINAPDLQRIWDSQQEYLTLYHVMVQIEEALLPNKPAEAIILYHENVNGNSLLKNQHLAQLERELKKQLEEIKDTSIWEQANPLKNQDWPVVSRWLHALALKRETNGKSANSEILTCMAQRYKHCPPPLSTSQAVVCQFEYLEQYLNNLSELNGKPNEDRNKIAKSWISDILNGLSDFPMVFPDKKTEEKLARIISESQFWEEWIKEQQTLDMVSSLADKFRDAGYFLSAYKLLGLASQEQPEELKIGVDFLRENFDKLRPKEKKAMVKHLKDQL